MKIAFDHMIFLLQSYGGISRYFVELKKEIKLSNNVKIFCPIYLNNYIENEKNIFKFLKIKKIPKYTKKLLNSFNFNLNEIYFNLWKPDIIHKTYFSDYKYNFKKAKKVINVWDLNHEIYHYMYNKPSDWRPKKNSLEIADHVICSSYKTRNDLIKYYDFNIKKTSVIYQGVNKFKETKKINYNKEKYLLYVGSRLKYKNFKNLLISLSINKQILQDFKLICFGEENINSYEKYLINSLKLNKENILFVSGNDFKLQNYYLNATALIFPSQNEGFGFPPLEAMSFGCPVITSNNTAILEATNLPHYYNFDPNIPEDISRKIQNVIYSKSNINFLINYGLQRIKELSWEKTCSEILEVYKRS